MIASRIRRVCFATLFATTLLFATFPVVGAQAASPPSAPVRTGAIVSPAVHMDVSPPLRDIVENQQDQQGRHEDHKPKPIRPPRPRHSPVNGTSSSPTTTTAVPTTVLNFDGVGSGFSGPAGTFTVSSAPPDTNLAVGPNHVVEIVNTDFAIFNKSGTAVFGPVPINTLWSGFGGNCQTDNDGDPTVKYDSVADRWVVTQFAVTSPSPDFLQCVAVSQTNDPTGAYNRYSFSYGDNQFPDYAKLSVWPDAYYITFNMFNAAGTSFLGGQACAYDRASMLAGQAATQQCFSVGTSFGGLLASDLDGSHLPPAGSPNHIVADGASPNQLAYWQFHTDWTTPANTTLTGPTTLATAAFTATCGGTGGTCVPQSGTTQQLDTLGDRVMYRLAYRNFGDHEALVVSRSVSAGSSIGVRWYELRTGAANSLNIFQQGTYAPDSNYRWMGSIAQDQSGDMGLGFSISGSSLHPGIHYTGRLAGDPAGTMSQGEATIIDGAGSQTAVSQTGQPLSRWGDYSAMAVDPVDGCTFWYSNQYIPSNGAFNWKTRIGTFKFPSCGTPPPPNDFSISAVPGSQTVNQGAGTTYTVSTATTSGSAQTVRLSTSGAPAGATATLSPTSVTSAGSSTLTVTTSTATPSGTYTITVTGTGSATHSTIVSLVVNAVSGTGITNGGFESGSLSGWTTAGTTSITTASHAGTYAAMVGGTSPTSDSSIAQTFTAPTPAGPLSFWYKVVCPDAVTYDWASATLRDNTSNASSTLLANTCTNTGAWVQSSPALLAGGHSYTLTLANHDDNYPGDPTYTLYDGVALAAAPPTSDFSISASPASGTVTQGAGTTYTVSTATTAGTPQTVNLSASGLPASAGASLSPSSITSGSTSIMSVTTSGSTLAGTYPITITGTGSSATHSTSVTLVVNVASPTGIANGGFETGNLTGWTTTGTASISTSSHTGSFAGLVGSTSPTNGDSSIAQTFTSPNGSGPLSFWYKVVCTDAVTYDWASATLRDNTSATSSTLLANTCTNSGAWVQSSPATLVGGHSYTLTLANHDDNYPGDPTYTLYDDVALAAPPAPNFSISATPGSQAVNPGASTTYTVSTTTTFGSPQTVNLSASGLPAGAGASLSPSSVTSGGNSTLTVTTSSSTPAGTYLITITGTGSTATHGIGVSLVVNGPNGVVNGGFETGDFTGWTRSGATAISTTAHTGTDSAQVGSASPFSGDSSISQMFNAPGGTGHTLTFWYQVVCTDSVTYDWATATLRDNTTATTTTVLARTCTNGGGWIQRTVSLTGSHSYTLTLTDHDDNYATDPTYTLYDDVSVS